MVTPIAAAHRTNELESDLSTYFELSPIEQRDALEFAAQESGRPAAMLEKDLWVVWTLEQVFALQGQPHHIEGIRGKVVPPMAFKGGTSLSKVYGVIKRFSEDVDLAFEQRAFETGIDVYEEKAPSNKQRDQHQERELVLVNRLIREVIQPTLLKASTNSLIGDRVDIAEELESDGTVSLIIRYPSLSRDSTLREGVKLEAGGRNPAEPLAEHVITPDLVEFIPNLEYSRPRIQVLRAERTFWEKATLIHAECHREQPDFKTVQRKSRHWSDLVELYQSSYGESALQDTALMHTVIDHKNRFYKSARARYDLCRTGQFKLVPDAEMLALLEADYQEMERFFYGAVRPFGEQLEVLRDLEARLNAS